MIPNAFLILIYARFKKNINLRIEKYMLYFTDYNFFTIHTMNCREIFVKFNMVNIWLNFPKILIKS